MTKAERLERDIKKLAEMKAHEDELRAQGYCYVAGIDEVGRGPLAGPVYAACVVLPENWDIPGINDSKKLSAKRREELSEVIKEKAVAWGIGIADSYEIDEINILEATKNAMKRAVAACNETLKHMVRKESVTSIASVTDHGTTHADLCIAMAADHRTTHADLCIAMAADHRTTHADLCIAMAADHGTTHADLCIAMAADHGTGEACYDDLLEMNATNDLETVPQIDMLLIDAVKLDVDIPTESIIKGDEKSLSIAAASIVAKVARDNYMTEMDEMYPGYDFAGNKGYGTAKHYEGLRIYGYTPIHRRSFLKKFEEERHGGRTAWGKSSSESASDTYDDAAVQAHSKMTCNDANSGQAHNMNNVKVTTQCMAHDSVVKDGIAAPEYSEIDVKGNTELAKKIYAVRKGRCTGIFANWDECKTQVDGYPGAEYKSFKNIDELAHYMGIEPGSEELSNILAQAGIVLSSSKSSENSSNGNVISSRSGRTINGDDSGSLPSGRSDVGTKVKSTSEDRFPEGVRAYVDGSYDHSTKRFSCGVVMIRTDAEGNVKTRELSEAYDNEEAAKQRNVAGEIMGAKTAIDFCLRQGIPEVEIYHDYEGVGKWADGLWKANNPLTQGYKSYVAKARTRMKVTFVKVKAHAGNKYNELADKLAKEALK